MKPVDAKPSTFIDFNKENNKEVPKCEVGDNVIISEFKHKLAKSSQLVRRSF